MRVCPHVIIVDAYIPSEKSKSTAGHLTVVHYRWKLPYIHAGPGFQTNGMGQDSASLIVPAVWVDKWGRWVL
jgi:hypothetical protein